MSLSYIVSRCVFIGIGTFIDTFLLKEIINIYTTTADILSVAKVLTVMFAMYVIRLIVFRILENYFWTRMVGFTGKIQRELMEKAQLMDLKCYDIPEYFDDFIIAASQSEEMCKKAIVSVADISSNIGFYARCGNYDSYNESRACNFSCGGICRKYCYTLYYYKA